MLKKESRLASVSAVIMQAQIATKISEVGVKKLDDCRWSSEVFRRQWKRFTPSLPKIAQDNKIPGCFHPKICEITGAFDKLQHQSKVWEYFLKFSKVLGRPRALPTTQFNVYLKAVNSLFVRSIN